MYHSKTDPNGVILGIRVRRLSWTPYGIIAFCPTFGMSTQVFLISYGPLQGSRVKLRGHKIAHGIPLIPRTNSRNFGLSLRTNPKSEVTHCVRKKRASGSSLAQT